MTKHDLVREYEELTKDAFLEEIPDDDSEAPEEDDFLARVVGPSKVRAMGSKRMFSLHFDLDEGEEE
jgi:hypothetical protein